MQCWSSTNTPVLFFYFIIIIIFTNNKIILMFVSKKYLTDQICSVLSIAMLQSFFYNWVYNAFFF